MREFVRAIAVAAALLTVAEMPTASAHVDQFDFVRRLIRVAYPDLLSGEARAMIPLSMNQSWRGEDVPRLTVLVYKAETQGPMPSDLVVHYQQDTRGMPRPFTATGPYVSSDRIFQLREEINRQPNLTDAAIARRLEALGATFGPRRQGNIAEALDVMRFRAILGDFQVQLARFDFWTETNEPGDRQARLVWHLRCASKTATSGEYWFDFEPFDGKVIGIYQPFTPLPAHGQ